MKTTTAERLKYLMESRNLRQADILEMIQPYCQRYGVNIPRNALSQYVTGKVLPKQDKLTILGLALNVSEVWLMGYDVPMEREAPAAVRDEGREEFIRLFLALDQDNRSRILDLMRALLVSKESADDQKG